MSVGETEWLHGNKILAQTSLGQADDQKAETITHSQLDLWSKRILLVLPNKLQKLYNFKGKLYKTCKPEQADNQGNKNYCLYTLAQLAFSRLRSRSISINLLSKRILLVLPNKLQKLYNFTRGKSSRATQNQDKLMIRRRKLLPVGNMMLSQGSVPTSFQ